MEPNIISGIAAVVVVLAAVILTHRFGPKKRNEFIIDLLKAIGEPARRPIPVEHEASRRRSDRGSPGISSRIHEGPDAGHLCKAN